MNAIMTIDTESHKGVNPVYRLIWGVTSNNKRFGIEKIMDICEENNVKALFFVDIAEAWDYGEEQIAEVMRTIKNRGHDVGVHIHPDHMADKKRVFLWEYSYQEQFDIIKKCTEFYEKVLGEKPKAFRSGKYGSNADTLGILAALGYLADFSEFYGQKWCQIKPEITKNTPVMLPTGLKEYPVTVYQSFSFRSYKRTDKIDLEMPLSEFKYVVSKYNTQCPNITLSLFAHSFSLLRWRRTPNSPKVNYNNCKKLSKSFEFVKSKGVNILSLDELLSCDIPSADDDYICMKGFRSIFYFIMRSFKVLKMRIDIKLQK